MKIAFATENQEGINSMLSQHFGRCPFYTFVELDENNNIKSTETKENPFFQDHKPGVVPKFIKDNGANVIFSGSMGPNAINAFKVMGIEAHTTTPQTIKEILEDFLEGKYKDQEAEHRHYD